MILDFMDTLNEWGSKLQTWVSEAVKNPFFFLLFIVVGILIFKIVYDALNKHK